MVENNGDSRYKEIKEPLTNKTRYFGKLGTQPKKRRKIIADYASHQR